MNPKGHENAFAVRMIYLDTKEEKVFKSVAYASRTIHSTEHSIKQSLNPVNKKRFEYNGRTIIFRTIKP